MRADEISLFIVVVGGKTKNSNIELHDVRWVIGSKIEDTYNQLKRDWFGEMSGFHIDSYKKINYIDGHKINVINHEKNVNRNKKYKCLRNNYVKKLWFVNLGAYDPFSMIEKHDFGLYVAFNSNEAKTRAKNELLKNFSKRHKDDLSILSDFNDVDDCHPISSIDNWEIELLPDINSSYDNFYPDWYGYLEIN